IVANCSSRLLPRPTLPGLMRYLSSATAQSGNCVSKRWPLKWKSPISGAVTFSSSRRSLMRATCAAASGELTVIRTISEPACASAMTWRTVASASAVSVLVIDCTTTGEPSPTATVPTFTRRVLRRLSAPLLMTDSFQSNPGHIHVRVRKQIDRLVVIDQLDAARVAHHQRQRRISLDQPLSAGCVQPGKDRRPTGVAHFDPGFALEYDPHLSRSGSDHRNARLGRWLSRARGRRRGFRSRCRL